MRSRFAVRHVGDWYLPCNQAWSISKRGTDCLSQTLNLRFSTIFSFISKRHFDVVLSIQENSSCISAKASQHNLWRANNRLPSNCQCPSPSGGWELSFLLQSSPPLPSLSRSLLPQISSRRGEIDVPLLCDVHDNPNAHGILDGSIDPRQSNQRESEISSPRSFTAASSLKAPRSP